MLETSFVDRHEQEQMSFSDYLTTFDQLQLPDRGVGKSKMMLWGA